MGDKLYIPHIILSFAIPRDDNTESDMRRTIVSADVEVDSVEFHRRSKGVYQDDYIVFPATVRLKSRPRSLRTSMPLMAEMTARDICQELALMFPSERYSVSWSVQLTSVAGSTIYSLA